MIINEKDKILSKCLKTMRCAFIEQYLKINSTTPHWNNFPVMKNLLILP